MSTFEEISNRFSTKFGGTIEPRRIPLTDPALNKGFGGGFPLGRSAMYYSPESTGKSTIALSNCLDFCNAGLNVVYFDFERSVTEGLISGVGLSKYLGSQFTLIKGASTYGHLEEMVEEFKKADNIGLFVIDSEARIVPDGLMERSITEQRPGEESYLTKMFIKKYGWQFNERDISTLWIQQIRADFNAGGFGAMKKTHKAAGGKALHHEIDIKVEFRIKKTLKDETGRVYGAELKANFDKNRTAARNLGVETVITYGVGFDPIDSLISRLENAQTLMQKGAFYTLAIDYDNPQKFKGKSALVDYLRENYDSVSEYIRTKED